MECEGSLRPTGFRARLSPKKGYVLALVHVFVFGAFFAINIREGANLHVKQL